MIVFRARWGRTWAARLDVDAAVRIRDLADLDLMAVAVHPKTRERLAGPSREASADLAAAYYAIFLPQIERRGLTSKQFGKRLRAVNARDLRTMFFEELGTFFKIPGPRKKAKAKAPEPKPSHLWRDLYRLAGEAGVPPGPYTFGELAVMADGRRRAEWARNALLRADVANSNPFREGPAVDARKLDPTGGLRESGRGRGGSGCTVTPDNLVGVFGALLKGVGRG